MRHLIISIKVQWRRSEGSQWIYLWLPPRHGQYICGHAMLEPSSERPHTSCNEQPALLVLLCQMRGSTIPGGHGPIPRRSQNALMECKIMEISGLGSRQAKIASKLRYSEI